MIGVFSLAFLARNAFAGPFLGPELIAGYEGNLRSGYSFATLTSPSADNRIVPIARTTVSYLYYEYLEPTGEQSEVTSPGIGVGVGLRWRPPRFSITFGPGYEVRYTAIETNGVRSTRADHGPSVSADLYYQAGAKTALATMGYFGFAQNYLWARALVKRQILPVQGTGVRQFSLGIDGTLHGNDFSRGVAGGLFGELGLPGAQAAITLQAGLGKEIQADAPSGLQPFVGASIYKSF